ncbi:MAG TPA: hypothetical protein VGJ28_06305, partial [Micromonosporaceae bacterium]
AGLSVFSSSTDVRSTGAQIVAADSGHAAAVATQFALTEGASSIALAVVAVALGRFLGSSAGRIVTIAGLVASGIALVQCALGILLAVSLSHPGRVGTLTDTVNRMDGVKMFVLAVMAVAAIAGDRLPRWLRWVGLALAVAIIASGVGYAFLNTTLATAAWLSLPLLLVFVSGAGIVISRRSSVVSDAPATVSVG